MIRIHYGFVSTDSNQKKKSWDNTSYRRRTKKQKYNKNATDDPEIHTPLAPCPPLTDAESVLPQQSTCPRSHRSCFQKTQKSGLRGPLIGTESLQITTNPYESRYPQIPSIRLLVVARRGKLFPVQPASTTSRQEAGGTHIPVMI